MANFQETYLASIRPGMDAEVYLMSYPNRKFHGKVQGLGWAIQSPDVSTPGGLPSVEPTLNWTRLAPAHSGPHRTASQRSATTLPEWA